MQQYAAFHQGLHCLRLLKQPSETEIPHNKEKSTCDSLKYKWAILGLSEYKGLKQQCAQANITHQLAKLTNVLRVFTGKYWKKIYGNYYMARNASIIDYSQQMSERRGRGNE